MNIMMNTVNPKYLIFFIVTFTIHPSYTQNGKESFIITTTDIGTR